MTDPTTPEGRDELRRQIALSIDPFIEYENPDGPGELTHSLTWLVEEFGWDQTLHIDEVRAMIARINAVLDAKDAEIERLLSLIHQIDKTLMVPAAEYVPAIGDVFKLIDDAKCGAKKS